MDNPEDMQKEMGRGPGQGGREAQPAGGPPRQGPGAGKTVRPDGKAGK